MHFSNIEDTLKLMTWIGVNPYKHHKLQTAWFYFVAIGIVVIIYLTLAKLYYDVDVEFAESLHTINICVFFVHGIITLVNIRIKRKTLRKLLDLVRDKFWQHENLEMNENEKLTYMHLNRNLRWKYLLFVGLLLLSVCAVSVSSVIIKGRITKETFPVPLHFPKHVNLKILFYSELYVTFNTVSAAIVTDAIVFTVAFLAEMQFMMLNSELRNVFGDIANGNNSIHIRKRLKNCIDHLSDLQMNLLNDCFSIVLLILLAIMVLSLCSNMYVITTTKSFYLMFFATTYLVALFCQVTWCYFHPVQCLVNAADRTANCFYLSDWYNYPEYYKDVCILLGKAQQAVFLSAGGLTDINYMSLVSTLKAVMSYLAFIQTIGDPDA